MWALSHVRDSISQQSSPNQGNEFQLLELRLFFSFYKLRLLDINTLWYEVQAMAVGLQLVSAFWFCKIARMVRFKLAKRTSKKAV